ncbi:aa3-type cytochrome oxidase subunit II [Glutamicibacter arilaitensis]|uniref:aa3-type cytochrome oxidase subunit II n=1 Tax=Glutamicibacter TaxID=1742989 RepID=UPI0005A2C407|nr:MULTISPECIES: cytochrome c oxidase subunit II [Glutamicibacter]HCH46932.1 cytochrome c oxidase subunit II [Glutamicibacter sp.]HCJ54106.1 cytochrome c oxidase subunit II [Glutamicibacter sp.]
MSSQDRTGSRGSAKAKVLALVGTGALLLTGCSAEAKRGWLPNVERDTTNHTGAIQDFWVNSWIAVIVIGVLTWGLMLWCVIAYRRRKNDTGYPRQLSYNMPLEIFYTAIPLVLVLVFFSFNNNLEKQINTPVDSEVVVDVRAKQWSWDFNYSYQGTEKYYAGEQAHLNTDGSEGVREELPTLYLPAGKSVTLKLNSRDVIHSFWVPAFLQKLDMIPGKTNYIYLTPQVEGSYDGKCAELCGEYHSEMLFNVEVVNESEFKAQLAKMEDGHLGEEYDRQPDVVNGVVVEHGEGE